MTRSNRSQTLCVGTAGLSVWFSDDLGESWARPYSESGLYLESRVWALAQHPALPGIVFAGTDSGVYRGDVRTRQWTHLPSAMDRLAVWSLALHPDDPQVMVAGVQPAALYRTADGGATWRKVRHKFAERCIFVDRPRVTQLLFDPDDPNVMWAGVEIDGVHRSADGGRTWTKLVDGLVSQDIHGLAVDRNGGRTIYCATNKGLHVSRDEGRHWRFRELPSPWQYCRAVQVGPDGRRLFLTNGNGPPGSTGRLLVSDDHGANWRDAGLPGELNSTPWIVAMNPADRDLLFCGTNLGQLFRSTDGGRSWLKLKREFGELRTLAWLAH
ncbi:MAG: hypothetical protein FJX68_15630 [Alphaproteobacteria bacterium]|nr:hypothetical protein [Alphaproteobacteria bacterium]